MDGLKYLHMTQAISHTNKDCLQAQGMGHLWLEDLLAVGVV